VSYALAFSSGARQSFSRLDVRLQEEVLDELDRAASAAGVLPQRAPTFTDVLDIRRDAADRTEYVFLTVEYDPLHQTLMVQRLGYHSRPPSPR
jgi:hypothetical protein